MPALFFHSHTIRLTPGSATRLCSSSTHLSGSRYLLLGAEELLLPHIPHPIPSCGSFLPLTAAAGKSRASSKSKVTRSTKSNADLCNELREFISMTGLPKNSVPSIKVLSEHGRKDLANIVRRRGYKLITVLLQDRAEVNVDADIEDISLVNDGACNIHASNSTDGKERGVEALHEDELLANEAECHSSTNEVEPNVFDFQMNDSIGYSVNSTLHQKALNFVQDGVLEQIEGAQSAEESRTLGGGSDVSHAKVSIAGFISVLGHAEAENDMVEAATWRQAASVLGSNGGYAGSNLNTGAGAFKEAEFLAEDHKTRKDDSLPSKELNSLSRDQDSVQTSKKENQAEINLLKEMLQQKELELSQLKQQIEDEKLALSMMQSKANDELGNAQRILLEKDAELLAAEETLSGLKEVEIQYWADGEVVEIAGSFNGWHQHISMDRHVSSEATSSKGLRNSVLWSTVLWLYPGTYEIKFIVDGNWRLDLQREFVSRGHIQNNILRVDR